MNKSSLLITIGLSILTIANTPNINATTIGHSKDLASVFGDDQNGNTKKIDESIDVNNHEEVIHTDVNTILELFGEEKALEVINNHFLIELNELRKKYGSNNVFSSKNLVQISQEQADYLDNLGHIEHTFGERELPKRIDLYGLEYHTCGENLADGQIHIAMLIKDWLTSKSHKDNLNNKNFIYIGLGYKNGKWVYTAIG